MNGTETAVCNSFEYFIGAPNVGFFLYYIFLVVSITDRLYEVYESSDQIRVLKKTKQSDKKNNNYVFIVSFHLFEIEEQIDNT